MDAITDAKVVMSMTEWNEMEEYNRMGNYFLRLRCLLSGVMDERLQRVYSVILFRERAG